MFSTVRNVLRISHSSTDKFLYKTNSIFFVVIYLFVIYYNLYKTHLLVSKKTSSDVNYVATSQNMSIHSLVFKDCLLTSYTSFYSY